MATVAFEDEITRPPTTDTTTPAHDSAAVPATARHRPRPVGAGALTALQRAAGNSAVATLLAEKGIEGEDEPFKDGEPAAEKCACSSRDAKDDSEKAGASADVSVQRQPPPPPPPPPPPAGVASINYLPVLKDLVPAGWGATTEDDAVVDITAYASGGAWKCVITKADQQAHQGVRLLAGVTEVTAGLVGGSDCAKLATIKKSLNDVANQSAHSGFYMLSAVQAHEDLHITQYRAALNPAFGTLKTAVEGLSVPAATAPNAAAAKGAIKALPAFTTALATFRAADVAANNATASHSPMAPFSAIEHTVVDPMITTIDTRRTTLKCA